MARNIKTFHQIISKSEDTKTTTTRKILPVYTQEINPKINSKRIKAELLKFQIELKQNGISAIHQHLQANTTSKQTFVTLYHPYPMKIALIKENPTKNQHHLNSLIINNRGILSNQNPGVSSNFRR
jgi:hypothetical protein